MSKVAVLRIVKSVISFPDLMRLALGAACSFTFLIWTGKITLPPLSLSFFTIFIDGGGFMWPILFILIFGLVLVLKRLLYLKALINNDLDMTTIVATIKQWGWRSAVDRLEAYQGPVIQLFIKGFANKDAQDIESLLDNEANIELSLMEKNMSWINLSIATAPLMGFLGSVWGMIQAFNEIKLANDISPSIVAGGISVALITTAFGLIVAVVLQIFQCRVLSEIDNQFITLQQSTTQLLDEIKSNNWNSSA